MSNVEPTSPGRRAVSPGRPVLRGGAVNRSGVKSPRGPLPPLFVNAAPEGAPAAPTRPVPTPLRLAEAAGRRSERHSPRTPVALGGMLVCQYPAVWRSQGGLAAELAAVLDHVRDDGAPQAPSLQKLESCCHKYDLGTEVGRFRMRIEEVFAGLAASLPKDLLKGLFDMTSEAAWWLLQAYSREELRGEEVVGASVVGLTDEETSGGVEDAGPVAVPLGDASKKIYWESDAALATLESRCRERITTLANGMAMTDDSAAWAALVGTNATQQLLRELELGANDPTTRDLGSRIFLAVEAAFDQYSGLRQIGDFRGLPEAPFKLEDAVQLVGRLYEHTMVLGLQTLENLELVDEAVLGQAFESLCHSLVLEYQAFKDGVLLRLGYMSSLRERDRTGRSLNSSVVLDYVRDVMSVCDECVEQMTSQFNDRVRQIELLPAAKQSEVFSSMGGRQELGQRVRAHLFQIKPWARESIQVQTQSLLQREVFGKGREEIIAILNQSKTSMLSGFRALIEGRMPEPLNRLSEIIDHLDSALEPILSKKPSALRRGKTSKSRKGNKKGPNEPSVAFSGMTIRGNMFKDSKEEWEALGAEGDGGK